METLYHGSRNTKLTKLEPRMDSISDDQKEPRVWATHILGGAAIFIIDFDDDDAWSLGTNHIDRLLGRLKLNIYDRNAIIDRPGVIYVVDGEQFQPKDGRSDAWEHYSTRPVDIVERIEVESPLEFAAQNGVKIIYHD